MGKGVKYDYNCSTTKVNKDGGQKTGGTRKPDWEWTLPKNPTRMGGVAIKIEDPKEYVEHFGFRASEFGHYMNDDKGREHLSRSAEAFVDLAAILEIPVQAVSSKGSWRRLSVPGEVDMHWRIMSPLGKSLI